MSKKITEDLRKSLKDLEAQGFYKKERIITTPQGVEICVDGKKVLNFCSNDYLGLANDSRLIKAACKMIKKWGVGLASVPFICGTQSIHEKLEEEVSRFLGMEDAILAANCYAANTGVFAALFNEHDAIICDELIHNSLIIGTRLSSAHRFIYEHSDMGDYESEKIDWKTNKPKIVMGLERCLKKTQDCRYRAIVTDGVFSMDGDIAKLKEISDLTEKYDALIIVDDSHGTGYIGPTGRGSHEHCEIVEKVDIITTTFGKALGGALGGCVSGKKELIEMLRQRSVTRIFSNSLAPVIVGIALKALDIASKSSELRDKVMENAVYFRKKMVEAGFDIVPGETAIVPVMLYKEPLAVKMAAMLFEEGINVVGFTYTVVPKGKARIRVQLSAAHSIDDVDKAICAFVKVGKELGIIK